MTTQDRSRIIGATTVGVIGNAVLGSAATDTKSWWYRTLRKPAIQPPSWLFPVAWTALYVDMAAVVASLGRTKAILDSFSIGRCMA